MIKEHRSHGEIGYAEEVLPVHIEALTGLIPYANEAGTKAANALIRLKEGTEMVRRQGEHEVDNVRDYFSKLKQALAEREEELVDNVQRGVDEKVHEIAKQRQVIEEGLQNVRACIQSVQHIAEHRPDDIEVLSEDAVLKVRLISHAEAIKMESNKLDENWEVPAIESPVLVNIQLEHLMKSIGVKSQSSPPLPQRHSVTQSLRLGSPISNIRISLARSDSDATTYSEPYSPEISRENSFLTTAGTPPPTPPLRKQSHSRTVEICEPAFIIGERSLTCSMFRNLSQNVLPCGVCIGANNTIVVTDSRNHCLRILTMTGKCLEVFGSEGKGDGQFVLPNAVAVGAEGNILVVDKDAPRIQNFTSTGACITQGSTSDLWLHRYLPGQHFWGPVL